MTTSKAPPGYTYMINWALKALQQQKEGSTFSSVSKTVDGKWGPQLLPGWKKSLKAEWTRMEDRGILEVRTRSF